MSPPRWQFLAFFLVAFGIYGGVHAYLWRKAARLLALHGAASLALLAALLALALAPFLGRLLRDGSPALTAVELVAFVWMGLVFYLFVLHLGVDLYHLGGALLGRIAPAARPPRLGGPPLFWTVCALSALIVAYAAVEASSIRLRRLEIPTPKLAAGSPALRIVQVSDIHLGMLLGKRRLAAILDRVREARPDVVVATGDVLDAVGDELGPLADAWRAIAPRWGKFAVTGNHEYYSGLAGALRFLERAGFRVLREETVVLPGALTLVGKDYPAGRQRLGDGRRPRPLAELVREGDPRLFTLLLFHIPSRFEEEAAPLGVDLQLSGHTHDGQLFPFRWVVRLFFRHTAGLVRAGNSLLYVSRGTGTWGPPLRFLAPPEVTLIELVPAGGGSAP